MDSLEAIQLIPPPRTFWNSNDPTLDPFDEMLVPTIASPLEAACSSTFLFPSTSSTCDSGDSQVFKTRPSQQQSTIIFDELPVEEGAESRGVANLPEYHSTSSQFSWLSAPPHYYPPQGYARPLQQQQLQQEMTELEAKGRRLNDEGQVRVQLNHYGGGQQFPDFFAPLNSSATSTALDSGHGSRNHTSGPLMRQPSFRRPDNSGQLKQQQQQQQQLNVVKTSWQSANMFELQSGLQRRLVSNKEPLGSPCSVISGFTKVVDQFVSTDYNMEISSRSFGPSTSAAAHDEAAVKYVSRSQESSTPEGGAHSMSGTQEIMADGVVKQLTTKRKRSKVPKHGNEVESQRMTHIAVERNRRKQMNEHLAALRALMPGSYVQKGDQASIVGGAIEFVKELEHLLHCLQAQKRRRAYNELSNPGTPTSRLAMPNPEPQFCQSQPPFSFHNSQRLVDQSPFLLGAASPESISLGAVNASTRHGPQMSGSYPATGQMISAPPAVAASSSTSTVLQQQGVSQLSLDSSGVVVGEARSDMASVEVKLVTGAGAGAADAALVKIMAMRRAGQLLRTVVALESLALTVLHTNITTVGHTVLYSFHVQIGALCSMNVDEIARALHQTFASLHALQF